MRRTLEAAPYGWPRDAIDTGLVALHRNGHLKAERDGKPLATAQLDQTAITRTYFRPERVRLTTSQRLKLRGLFGKLGVRTRSGEEEDGARRFLAGLKELAASAGGDPPLPAVPAPGFLQNLSSLAGNEQLAAILKAREEIETAIKEWKQLAERADERLRAWDLANALLRHAEGELEIAEPVGAELAAIREQRTLLARTDHATPCVAKLAGTHCGRR